MYRHFIYILFILACLPTRTIAQEELTSSAQADSLFKLGHNHARQSNWPKAISAYQAALKLYPDRAETHAALADIYRRNGIWSKAVEHYQKTLDLDPQHTHARSFLAPCQQALTERQNLGYIQAATLRQLAALDTESRELTRGFSPTPPSSSVPLHIEFGTGQYALEDLSANGHAQLAQVVQLLQSPEWQDKQLAVEGHTCTCGSAEGNKTIAHKRAATVRDYLVAHGIVTTAIHLMTHGEEKTISGSPHEDLPPPQCTTDVLHSMDRRVVIRQLAATEAASRASTQLLPPAQISFWYRPQKEEAFHQLQDGAILNSGDEFRVFMMAEKPVYAYLFHRGSAGDWICLFPNENFSLEAPAKNPIEAGRKYWLPRFSGGFVLDDTPGQEETLVYLSATANPTMEKWREEGVPSEKAEVEQQRGFGGIVEVQSVVDTIAWHLRIRFQHTQHP